MAVIDRRLGEVLGPRRFSELRVMLGVGGGVSMAPWWEEAEDGTVCLTWGWEGAEVVLLLPERGRPVLYRGMERVGDAGGVELAEAIRWLRCRETGKQKTSQNFHNFSAG